jgi:phage tail-like protein
MAIDANKVSSLLDSLPANFQDGRSFDAPNFLGRFLLGFEKLLLGLGDPGQPGLEETVATLYRYFEPGAQLAEGQRAPREFLTWLAGWVALTLREDWDEPRQRDLIARAVQLYRLRGTKRGVEEFVQIFTRLGAVIDELDTPFQIGVHSTVEVDTYLGGGAPFFFRVRVLTASTDPATLSSTHDIAQAIVDLQKPAHTFYTLTVQTPVLQVEVHSTVGVDTLLG